MPHGNDCLKHRDFARSRAVMNAAALTAVPAHGSLLRASSSSSSESGLGSHHSHRGKSHWEVSEPGKPSSQPPTPNWFCSKSDKPGQAGWRVFRIRLTRFLVHSPPWGHEIATLLSLRCTTLAQLAWPLGARKGPKSAGVRSWQGEP